MFKFKFHWISTGEFRMVSFRLVPYKKVYIYFVSDFSIDFVDFFIKHISVIYTSRLTEIKTFVRRTANVENKDLTINIVSGTRN